MVTPLTGEYSKFYMFGLVFYLLDYLYEIGITAN